MVMVMWQFMSLQVCFQDAAGSVSQMLKEAKSISQAFAAVAEGGNRMTLKYRALLNA
jgi:hypothetical protein